MLRPLQFQATMEREVNEVGGNGGGVTHDSGVESGESGL